MFAHLEEIAHVVLAHGDRRVFGPAKCGMSSDDLGYPLGRVLIKECFKASLFQIWKGCRQEAG